MSHFFIISYGDYNNYKGINDNIRFKSIKTVIIPVFDLNNKTINLYFINVKYCLNISLFNFIFISQLYIYNKGSFIFIKDFIS